MAGSHVVSLLTKKYAALLGELEYADRVVMDTHAGLESFDEAVYRAGLTKRDIEEKLEAIETVIWLFDANWDPSAIRPNYPRKRHAKPGAISRAAYAALRDAKVPLTTRELSRVVASRLGYERTEERDLARLDTAIYLAFKPRIGVTLAIEKQNPIRWALIQRDQVRSRRAVQQASRAA